MLDEAIAQSLLEHFEGATKYNINIMNEAGIIIASTDPSRLGSFHEAAYLLVSKQTPTLDIYQDGDYLGTKHGVNLTIQYRHKTVGVVGITGRPDEVRLPAQLLKASIEGLLEYEYQKQMQRMTAALKKITPRFGLFIYPWKMPLSFGGTVHTAVRHQTFYLATPDGVSMAEWLGDAVDGNVYDCNLSLLTEGIW